MYRCALPTSRFIATRACRQLTRACSSATVLWHNPDCSKSRAALKLLEERGEPFQTREYLKDPPTSMEVVRLQEKLGLPPIEWCAARPLAPCLTWSCDGAM